MVFVLTFCDKKCSIYKKNESIFQKLPKIKESKIKEIKNKKNNSQYHSQLMPEPTHEAWSMDRIQKKKVRMARTARKQNSFNIPAKKNCFNVNDVAFDFSVCCILVNFPILCIETRNINTIIHPLPVPQIITIIYITDGKTQQIFAISNNSFHENIFKYQKSHENAKITICYTD